MIRREITKPCLNRVYGDDLVSTLVSEVLFACSGCFRDRVKNAGKNKMATMLFSCFRKLKKLQSFVRLLKSDVDDMIVRVVLSA